MAASDLEAKERLHRLVDELDGPELSLAEAALKRLHQARTTTLRPRRQATLHRVLGIAATDRPPPTDEDVKRWLEEERIKKYGS